MSHSSETGAIANMAGIKTAIGNNETERLRELVQGRSFDSLQKSYLSELAVASNSEIREIIEQVPSK